MKLKVGDVVTLAMPMLGCTPGTRGVIYDIYEDFDDPRREGVCVIFENGEYDGFSFEEQNLFLNNETVTFTPFFVKEYKFENVMKLSQDFKRGLWDDIFR